MQDLKVIGVESGALLVVSDEGSRYRIAIDEVLQARLRQVAPQPGTGRKLAPREIQAHIRAGMSAEDVAAITGASLEHIQKYEPPVVAEREFVVGTALNVPVHTAIDTDPLGDGTTFGSAIRDRLSDLGATGERWASWKEASGWIVKLSFTANQIDHDARWQFDPKKLALAPLNSEAITLSQQGGAQGALIPRLRAVTSDDRTPDRTRFDSGAFTVSDGETADSTPIIEQVTFRSQHPAANRQAAEASRRGGAGLNDGDATPPARSDQPPAERSLSQTADLLEALRRRRGEREAAHFDDAPALEPVTLSPGIRLVDVPLDEYNADDELQPPARSPRATQPLPELQGTASATPGPSGIAHGQAPQAQSQSHTGTAPKAGRRGRAAMPSWDEIVFGARSDDDLA
ncbi:septation protein SepH [Salinibacterium sp. ZJ450]|uniref:septation protein SepH n=1 Tax=Salinibacterium sp. ZJ450 TaxID=2708338 RepID=UPI00141E988A|nr:septation protein SepH [Salinibacterium sp. ZJ450]